MAEELKEMSDAEMYEDTLGVLEKEFESMHAESTEEAVDAPTQSESTTEEEPTEQKASDTPTYEEAETAQQTSSNTEDDRHETSTEAVSESASNETRPELDEEDADVYGNLKPKAQERFEHWINRAKELETENENMQVSRQLHEYIAKTNTNPEQLVWSLNVFNSLNSGNYEQALSALKALDTFADQIGERLGVNRTNNEQANYTDHEDLSNAVENLEMSEEWATKLAQQRTEESAQFQAQNDFQQYNNEEQQYATAYQDAANQAFSAITDWENQIKETDPDYALKSEAMIDVGKQLAKTNFPPQDWLPMLQNEYNVLSRGMSIAAQQNGNASKQSRPLAPGRSNGGVGSSMELQSAEVTPEFLQAHLDAMHN